MNLVFSIHIYSIEELPLVAKKIDPYLKMGTIFFMDGELGAGKTTLISEVCKLSSYQEVSSPTYSLLNIYQLPYKCDVYHYDLYRIADEDDLESIGMWEHFLARDKIFFVEWFQMIPMEQWPMDWIKYVIKIQKSETDENFRKIELYELN